MSAKRLYIGRFVWEGKDTYDPRARKANKKKAARRIRKSAARLISEGSK